LSDLPWSSLAAPRVASDISARRVNETSRWGFYWARDSEGRCLLILSHDAASTPRERLPRLRGIEVFIRATGTDAKPTLVLCLLDTALRDIFYQLCRDIVSSTDRSASESEAVATALTRTWRWHHLLRGGGAGLLSPDEQKGLIGELLVLERYILTSLPAADAINAWRGPLGGPKDFVIGRIAIESKARGAAAANSVHISSEFQLDDTDSDALFLHLSVLDSTDTDDDRGFTVTDVACRLRDQLQLTDSCIAENYNALLMAIGFRYEDDYSHARWYGGERGVYRVSGAFPRLTSATVPTGVEHVKYMLSLAHCGSFLTDPTTLKAAIAGAAHVD
jgi:hypothetical protein